MESELLIAALAGLGGMFGWGLADFFAKKTIDEIGDVTSLAWGHVFGTLSFLALAMFQPLIQPEPIALPTDPWVWVLLVLFGVVQAAVYFLLYRGFGKGQVAVLNPVFASFAGIAAVLSIVFFDEAVTAPLLASLAVLFCGVLLISVDFSSLKSKKTGLTHVPGFKEVAMATLLAAFWTLFWDRFIGGQNWLLFAVYMYSFMTFAILILAKAKRVRMTGFDPRLWKYLVLIGVCETVAYLSISLGFSATSMTSVVAILSGAFSLPTIVLAHIFLKERLTLTQTVGGLVIVAGIMILSIS